MGEIAILGKGKITRDGKITGDGNMAEHLLEKLEEYSQSDYYPLHMPGHKRNISHFGDPFRLDITEIEGFDNLHHAEGVLLEAQ